MMSNDPTQSVIVVEVAQANGELTHVKEARDAQVDKVLRTVRNEQDAVTTAQQVRRIFSEREITNKGAAFVVEQVPNVGFQFSFSDDCRWETDSGMALETAQARIRETLERQRAEDLIERKKQRAEHSLEEAKTVCVTTRLLPTLRNLDDFRQMVAYRPVTARLGVFLARVGPTPRGTVGTDYVIQANVPDEAADPMWQEAYRNLRPGIHIQTCFVDEPRGGGLFGLFRTKPAPTLEKKRTFYAVERAEYLAASIVSLPNFAERALSLIGGAARVLIGIPNPDTLLMCDATALVADKLRELALGSDYRGSVALTPCTLYLENGVLTDGEQRR